MIFDHTLMRYISYNIILSGEVLISVYEKNKKLTLKVRLNHSFKKLDLHSYQCLIKPNN